VRWLCHWQRHCIALFLEQFNLLRSQALHHCRLRFGDGASGFHCGRDATWPGYFPFFNGANYLSFTHRRSLDRYQPSQGSLASWMLSITHNRAIDELRSRRGKDTRREISDDILQPQAAIDPGFEEALLRGEIQQALEMLPVAQRDVIELVFWSGLTRREIAERLSLPLGTVHTRLRLGIPHLAAAQLTEKADSHLDARR